MRLARQSADRRFPTELLREKRDESADALEFSNPPEFEGGAQEPIGDEARESFGSFVGSDDDFGKRSEDKQTFEMLFHEVPAVLALEFAHRKRPQATMHDAADRRFGDASGEFERSGSREKKFCLLVGVRKDLRDEADARHALRLVDHDRVGARERRFDVLPGVERRQKAHVRRVVAAKEADPSEFRADERLQERCLPRPAGSRYDHRLRGCNGQDLCGKISANHFFLDGFVSNHRECSNFPQDDERRVLATRHVASRSDRRLGVPFPPQDPICPDCRVPVQVGGDRKGKTGKPLSPAFCRVSQKCRHPVTIHPRCNKFL